MKIRKEIKVGMLVVVGIGLLVYGLNFLKGIDILNPQKQYFAVYNRVDGLIPDNPVQVNGYKVGKVNSISFMPDNSGRIVVGLLIDVDELQIPKNTIARIKSLDLLGSRAVSLELGNSVVNFDPGDTLKSAIEEDLKDAVDARIRPLTEKANELLASIDSAVTVVQAILNKDARENLSQSFESIKRAIEIFEKTSLRVDTLVKVEKRKIGHIMDNVESVTLNIKNNNEQLANVIRNFSTFSDSLATVDMATTLKNADRALADVSNILEKVNNGEGSLGLLLNNDSLYLNLDKTIVALDVLLNEFNENPRRFLAPLGKRPKKRKRNR